MGLARHIPNNKPVSDLFDEIRVNLTTDRFKG